MEAYIIEGRGPIYKGKNHKPSKVVKPIPKKKAYKKKTPLHLYMVICERGPIRYEDLIWAEGKKEAIEISHAPNKNTARAKKISIVPGIMLNKISYNPDRMPRLWDKLVKL